MATNMKLENFSDRELLHILNDLSEGTGDWVDPAVMATRVGLSRNGMSDEQFALHARRCLSGRLGWIARLSGTVEREPVKLMPRWRLTFFGQQVVKARLSESQTKVLEEGLSDPASLAAIAALSRRYITSNRETGNLLRREWSYGTHRKRRG